MEEGCLLVVVFSFFAQASAWQTIRSNCRCNAGKIPEYMGQCMIYANGSRHCWMPACSAALEESLAVKTCGNLRSNSVRGLFFNYILWPVFFLVYICKYHEIDQIFLHSAPITPNLLLQTGEIHLVWCSEVVNGWVNAHCFLFGEAAC